LAFARALPIIVRMNSPIKICVIGAGPNGIAAAKNCIAAGLHVTVFEKNTKVGGNWVFNATTGHSSVNENTHIISSRAWSEYEDYPMPAHYPTYPHHSQLQAYFESYTKHFGVMPRIQFGHTITYVARNADGGWRVDYNDVSGAEQREQFTHLMVANGHHWNPRWPEIPGQFKGQYLHSHDFKGVNDAWRGKRVLVIGGGNSACDVAVEAARVAGTVALSMRSPQWFVPKFIFGKPSDDFASGTAWLPTWFRQYSFKYLLQLLQGSYQEMGLPVNTRPPLHQHPTLNSDLIDYIRHGRIAPRAGIAQFDGDTVVFKDGSRADYDIVVACTGFYITLPFFKPDFIDFTHADKTPLYLKMLHAQYANLYFIGLFQPLGCIWPMADMQARLAVKEIQGQWQRPTDMPAAIQHEMEHPHFDFDRAPRHSTEVDYHQFRHELKAQLAKAGVDIGKPPARRRGGVQRPVALPA
jgi:Flavin-binding monooxygenase-like